MTSRQNGFTLVEILVALAVIAIGLTAVMHNLGQNIDTAVSLRERTIAMWIAQNRLAQHRVTHDWPTPGSAEGIVDMAGQQWKWQEVIATSADSDLRRVEINVRATQTPNAVAQLVGYIAKPPGQP